MSKKCRWTGKIKFDTQKAAVERDAHIRLNFNPKTPKLYAYKCYHCGFYHFTRRSPSDWQRVLGILHRQQQQRIEELAEVVESRLFITHRWIKGRMHKDEFWQYIDGYPQRPTIRTWKFYRKTQYK